MYFMDFDQLLHDYSRAPKKIIPKVNCIFFEKIIILDHDNELNFLILCLNINIWNSLKLEKYISDGHTNVQSEYRICVTPITLMLAFKKSN